MPKPSEPIGLYLTRAASTNKELTTSAMLNAVKRFLPTLEKAAEDAVAMQRALQDAEIAERDPERRSGLEEAFQKLGAIRRISDDLFRQTRQLVQAFRELDDVNARIAVGSEPAPAVAGKTAAKPRAVKAKVVKSKPER